jgi:hypothetical protein
MRNIKLLARRLTARRKPKLELTRRITVAPWRDIKLLTDGHCTPDPLAPVFQLHGSSQGLL